MKKELTTQLRAFKAEGQIRELGSNSDWCAIEFLVYYAGNHIRKFAYVRRNDGKEIPDGDYAILDDLGEHQRIWKKRDGEWQVRWRKKWSRKR